MSTPSSILLTAFTISPEFNTVLIAVGTTLINAGFVYLGRRLIFKRNLSGDERENIAKGYASLIDSQQHRIDSQQQQINNLSLVVEQNRQTYQADFRRQKEQCDEEITALKEETAVHNAARLMELKALKQEYTQELAEWKRSHTKCEKNYAEVLLQLRALQLREAIRERGVPPKAPPLPLVQPTNPNTSDPEGEDGPTTP